jgi:plastocyanin
VSLRQLRRPLAPVLPLTLALAAAGCGGPQVVSRPSGPEGEPPQPLVEVQGAPAPRLDVTIRGFGYHPYQFVLRAGGEVTFVNEDPVPHTAVARAPSGRAPAFAVGPIPPGGEQRVTLEVPGTYVFSDRLHPDVVGRVEVKG